MPEFCKFLTEEKVIDIKMYDNSEWLKCIFGTASSLRHMRVILNKLKLLKLITKGDVYGNIEGGWVICSIYDFDFHIFTATTRAYYDLDELQREHGI